ncbi:MAG: PEGA domain-containing protein [Trueperaceae bacterium]|nr:PEGA domain-containing protein [Trueperaceae bacterium]
MKRILASLTFLILMSLAASAAAQEVRFDQRAIVVNPSPTFGVTTFVDKDGEVPNYRMGEQIRIGVRVDRDAYVYLYSLQPDDSVTQILPNRFDENNFLEAGETRVYPPSGASYTFNVEPPSGLSKVVAVASTRELDTRQLARFQSGQAFATNDLSQDGFQRAFRIVVQPVPQSSWVTATAYYQATREGSTPAAARLAIDSDPQGATVYLDGSRQGTTPLRIESRPGRRTIRIEADGYRTFESTVRLSPGDSRRIDAQLERVRRTGQLRFESTPSGADVFVDGSYQGTTPIGATTFDTGNVEVRFERDGYQGVTHRVTVEQGSTRTVRAELRPLRGTLRVSGNVGGAQVFLDGRSMGTLASGSGLLEMTNLEPGSYQLTVVAAGYDTVVRIVEIDPGSTRSVSVRQNRR